MLPGPALPAAAAELLSQRFVQGVVAQLLRALGVPLGEAPAPRAVLPEARVQELENLVLHSPHTVVIDKLGLSQLKQAGKQCARLGELLCLAALAELRDRLDIQINRVQRMPARRAIGAHVGGVQRIDPDHPGAEARGKLDQRAQVAEVADSPVALGANGVELHHEAPDPAALRQELRLVAGAFLHDDLFLEATRAQRLLERAPGLGFELVFALPDVEIARRDLAHEPEIRDGPRFLMWI